MRRPINSADFGDDDDLDDRDAAPGWPDLDDEQ